MTSSMGEVGPYEKAVEAAARELYTGNWDTAPEQTRDYWLRRTRLALGAADLFAGREMERLTRERDELDLKLKAYRFLDEDAAEEEAADEPERIDLVQLEAELRAHPHRALVESMADTWQQVDDDDGNGGGSGWYQSLTLACIDQWIRDLTELGWTTPEDTARLTQDNARLRDELRTKGNDLLDIRGLLSPNGGDRVVPFELGETVAPAVEWLIGRVARLNHLEDTARAWRATWGQVDLATIPPTRTGQAVRAHIAAIDASLRPTVEHRPAVGRQDVPGGVCEACGEVYPCPAAAAVDALPVRPEATDAAR